MSCTSAITFKSMKLGRRHDFRIVMYLAGRVLAVEILMIEARLKSHRSCKIA
jgi:hypothetical protein